MLALCITGRSCGGQPGDSSSPQRRSFRKHDHQRRKNALRRVDLTRLRSSPSSRARAKERETWHMLGGSLR